MTDSNATPGPYAERRRRLLQACPGGLVLVRGAGARGGCNPNLFYLTGLEEPTAVLAMAADGLRIGLGRGHPGPDYQRGRLARQVLFLPPADPLRARWGEDSRVTVGSVTAEELGVDAVLPTSELNGVLSTALLGAERLHYVRAAEPVLGGPPDPDAEYVAALGSRFFGLEIRDATGVVHGMRRLKDDTEVEGVRRAVRVTDDALRRAWGRMRPGVFEYELEAEIARTYRAAGGNHGFDPIVGSGPNACLLHYQANDRALESGELVLFDTGVRIDGYGCDITRTVPVDGRFSARQREIYEIVLRALERAVAACAPGVSPGEIHATAYEVIAEAGYGEAFVHGTSHHLGIETHDVGDRFAPLAPGAIITVEPGIYLPHESLGVRIEDDVLIRDRGYDVLSAAIPRTIEEIEAAVAEARG